MGLKQEMEHAGERIECIEYRFADRASELEEVIDSCGTRVGNIQTSFVKWILIIFNFNYIIITVSI